MQEPTTAEQDALDEASAAETPTEHDEELQEDAPAIIETKRLSKRLRGKQALRNVSITVRRGQVYGLLGAGGAGKTTLVKLLLDFLHPDSGEIHLFGPESLQKAKMRTGYLPQRARYHGNFSGRNYLQFQASLGGLGKSDAKQAATTAEEIVGLGDGANRRIGSYSKEQLRRLGLAVALVSGGLEPPDLLILDEPTGGLGDELGAAMRDVLVHCQEHGSTIFLCSRDLTPVEQLCTHAGVLRAGRLIAQTPVDLTPRINVVGLARDGAMEIAPHLFEYLLRLHPDVTVEGGSSDDQPLFVSLPTGEEVPRAESIKAAALRAILDARWDIVSVYIESRDIESLYLQAVPNRPRVEVEEEPKAKAPSTAPLAAVASITSPLPASDTSQLGEEPEGVAQVASSTAAGPSTTPLLVADGQVVSKQRSTDKLESLEEQPAPQLEPRKLRDRSNGVSQPGADSESEAGDESQEDAALVSDRS